MTPDEIRKNVAAEVDLVAGVAASLLAGQPADLAGFDARVATLCEATSALPFADAQALVPDFERLASALDELRAKVTAAQGSVGSADTATTP